MPAQNPPARTILGSQQPKRSSKPTKRQKLLYICAIITWLVVLVLHLVVVIYGVSWTVRIKKDFLQAYNRTNLNFYTLIFPVISFSLTFFLFGYDAKRLASQLFTLVYCLFFLAGWIAQLSVWLVCEIPNNVEKIPSWCPRKDLGSFSEKGEGKAYIGAAIAGVYLIRAAVSAAYIHDHRQAKARRAQKAAKAPSKEIKPEYLAGNQNDLV